MIVDFSLREMVNQAQESTEIIPKIKVPKLDIGKLERLSLVEVDRPF